MISPSLGNSRVKIGKMNEMIKPLSVSRSSNSSQKTSGAFPPAQKVEEIPPSTDHASLLARLGMALMNFVKMNPLCHVSNL